MYSQNEEEKFIVEFFNDFKGTLLSIGENDGKTFSNSLKLIELGWNAVLVEPSPTAFDSIIRMHGENDNVYCLNVAIGTETAQNVAFYESGCHFKDKKDFALLSSMDKNETVRWRKSGVSFTETLVDVLTYEALVGICDCDFNFITIDAEGMDLKILKQIDLSKTQLLCIEWNSIESIKAEILAYTSTFGMSEIIYQSGENLLLCKKQ